MFTVGRIILYLTIVNRLLIIYHNYKDQQPMQHSDQFYVVKSGNEYLSTRNNSPLEWTPLIEEARRFYIKPEVNRLQMLRDNARPVLIKSVLEEYEEETV